MKAKVAERGQVTIPKALRERLGNRSRNRSWILSRNKVVDRQETEAVDAVDQVFGRLGVGGIRMISFKKLEGQVITAVDTNILIDILEPDPVHGLRSKELEKMPAGRSGVACDVVWAEWLPLTGTIRASWSGPASHAMAFAMSIEAALGAARSWHNYRRRSGGRDGSLQIF